MLSLSKHGNNNSGFHPSTRVTIYKAFISYQGIKDHSTEMMRERRIDIKWIEKVLSNPEITEPDHEDLSLEHRFGKIAEHGGWVLRVVVNVIDIPVKVVTVYFDRTKRGQP